MVYVSSSFHDSTSSRACAAALSLPPPPLTAVAARAYCREIRVPEPSQYAGSSAATTACATYGGSVLAGTMVRRCDPSRAITVVPSL